MNIPKRLKREPLIEAIWQIQFEPANNQPIGDLLPGVLYSALKISHPGLRIHRLPIADIPAPVAQFDPNLRLAAKYRMDEPGSPFLFQTGDRVITVNCRRPYSGWIAFKEKIMAMSQLAKTSGLIQPQRHSIRYIDLLGLDPAPDLTALQIFLEVGREKVHRLPLQMRLELPDGDCVHVVQISTPAEVQIPGNSQAGTILDTETFAAAVPESWDAVEKQVDSLHDRVKTLFFEKLLTPEAIERLGPEY
jgi:uncharacterized protein (TIGR04255 family)